jgi:S1-C subfamily serine protease
VADLELTVYRGAVITDVRPGSAAAKALLAVGDVVTAVNGRPVDSAAALRNRIGLLRIGDQVDLTILRGGEPRQVSTQLTGPA